MRKSPLRKKSKEPISKLQRRLWNLCKQIIRKKYGNTCYTCGKAGLSGSNWHTSHLIPKASLGAFLKYDLRVLRPSCFHCNINLGGNGAIYLEKIREIEGEEYVKKIFEDRNIAVKAYDHYLSLIPKYEEILKELK